MEGSSFLSLGYNFLSLTINSIDEMEKQENKSLVLSDMIYSDDVSFKKYDEMTKWNDFNIGIPVLFNFFHGHELILKGILELLAIKAPKSHNLSAILAKLEVISNPDLSNLIIHLNDVLNNNGFEKFFIENDKNVDSYYILLKYPEEKSTSFKYRMVKGNNENLGLTRFLRIRELSLRTRKEIINWVKLKNQ